MEGNEPVVIPNAEGKRTTPSIVAFIEGGERKVETVYSIKRFMGNKYSESKKEAERVPYKVVKGDNDTPRVDIDGRLYTPQEISAMVLQKMKKAVVTVPAYFNDAQRQATKEAGEIAGLKVMLSTNGDTHLGGDDFDQVIIDWLADEFNKEENMDLRKDPMALQRLKEAAEKAKIELSSSEIDEVILVGGSTRMPRIQEEVKKFFGKDPHKAADNQPSVEIHVLQGERAMAGDNKTIGRFHLDGIPPAQRGVPQIEVTFDIDANGIINVSAKDKGTGKEHNIRIEASSGLSEEEIQKMKADAEANADADKQAKETAEKVNGADAMIFQTENQLKEFGDKLSADKKEPIEAALVELKKAHESKDLAQIDAAMETINEAWKVASEEMYKAQADAGGSGDAGATGEAEGSSATEGDDVQDVDFEEVKED
ncbi:UNVERIFIED_CONTAM: hypothetical protein GTU68_041524 [Idotea baltica]|nr:hypothetical protein [Idotea baltica]